VCRRRRQQHCTGHRAPVIPTRWLRRRSAALSVCRTAEAAAGDGSSPGFMISPFNNMQVTTTISLIFRLTVVNLSSRGWRRPVRERGLQDRCTGVTCQHPTRGLRRGSVRPVPREFFSPSLANLNPSPLHTRPNLPLFTKNSMQASHLSLFT
jgi:hypothetical protein